MAPAAMIGSPSLSVYVTLACLLCGSTQQQTSLVSASPDLGSRRPPSVIRCAASALSSRSSRYGAQLIRGKVLVKDGRTLASTFQECRAAARAAPVAPRGRQAGEELPPVVLIPGAGGNQLEIRLTSSYKAGSFWCRLYSSGNYFRVWLDVFSLIPPFTSCFAERMELLYDAETDTYRNNNGVESRVPYFGSTKGMQYLDPHFKSVSTYMAELVAALEKEGYVDGQSLLGAPYDFRYAPGPNAAVEARTYLNDLESLIESAYSRNANRKVVLVAHSLGGLFTLYFLNRQSVAWLQKYVSHFVSIATPWGGTAEQMKTFASGSNQGVTLLDPLYFRDEQRSSESNLWLLPVPRVFGSAPLVVTPSRNYTAHDMEDFLRDVGFPQGIAPYRSRIPSLNNQLAAPLVPVTVIYSRGEDTIDTLFYSSKSFDKYSDVVYGDGDGTVNLRSLTAVIEDWQKTGARPVRVVEVSNTTHSGCLTDSRAVQAIVGEILRNAAPDQTMAAVE